MLFYTSLKNDSLCSLINRKQKQSHCFVVKKKSKKKKWLSFSLYAVVTWLIILQDWEHALKCDCCSSASRDQRSRHGSSVPEHMILWHKHQFDYTTLIRAWTDDWREGGGLEGLEGLVGDSPEGFAYRTALHHQPQILKVNTFCVFILTHTVLVSLLLTFNLFLYIFLKTVSWQPDAFIMPPFHRHVSCHGCTPAGSSFSQIRSKVTAFYHFYWDEEIKARTERDGSYFDFYGLTASEVLHWVTLTVLMARSKNRKTKWSCSFKKIVKLWVTTELYRGFFYCLWWKFPSVSMLLLYFNDWKGLIYCLLR